MRVFFFLSLMLLASVGYAQSVKAYSYQYKDSDLQQVHLDLKDGEIEVKHWPHSTIFIETHINSASVSPQIIRNLAKTDRYKIVDEARGSSLYISSEVDQRNLIINGSPFEEKITYKVYVPKGLVVIYKGNQPK